MEKQIQQSPIPPLDNHTCTHHQQASHGNSHIQRFLQHGNSYHPVYKVGPSILYSTLRLILTIQCGVEPRADF
jgi:hypothetical protein